MVREKASCYNEGESFEQDLGDSIVSQKCCLSDYQKKYLVLKHVIDVGLSFFLLGMLAIPMGLVIAVLKTSDPHAPVFFLQDRIGLDEKVFKIIKFRTMCCGAPQNVATNSLSDREEYTTFWGGLLRKTSIDELPQLWNVIKGDMSLIGPRPLIVSEEPAQSLRKAANLYCIRPGITGLAQISGRDSLDDEKKVRLDKQYLESMSFWTDFKILVGTVFCVIRRENIR